MPGRLLTLRLDLSVKQSILTLLEADITPKELAELFKCHPATVY